MKTSTLLQFGFALMLALVAGFMILKWMQAAGAREARTVTTGPESVIVVATEDISRGAQLTTEMLTAVPAYADNLPATAHTDPEALVGRIVVARISSGEPVLESRLASPDADSGGVAVLIEKGKRAMTVKGNNVIGMNGFIRPGTRVDVLVTLDDRREDGEVVTKTVLENVRVLASGADTDDIPIEGEERRSSTETYTLEVTPEQGETLALAAHKGALQFSMRNPEDQEPILTEGASVTRALTQLTPAPKTKQLPEVKVARAARPQAPAPAPEPTIAVSVIRGATQGTVNF